MLRLFEGFLSALSSTRLVSVKMHDGAHGSILFGLVEYTPLQKMQHLIKGSSWPQFGVSDPMGSKSCQVLDLIYGLRLRELPLLKTFCPYWIVDPKLGMEAPEPSVAFLYEGSESIILFLDWPYGSISK